MPTRDWAGLSGRHDYLIGSANFSFGQIIKTVQSFSGHITFPLIDKEKQASLSLYQNSGLLHITRFSFKPLEENEKQRNNTEKKKERENSWVQGEKNKEGGEEGTKKEEEKEKEREGGEGEEGKLEEGEVLIVGNESPLDEKKLFPSQQYIGWLKQLKNFSSKNLNDEFHEVYDSFSRSQKASSRLPAHAKNYAYLICKGFMGGFIVGYWTRYFSHLKSNYNAVMVPLHTVGSSIHNAGIIKKYILKQTKPVILIGHSKGGVDSVVALSLYPELKEKVRGVICVQSPHGGSPVANDFVHKDSAAVFFSGALRSLMGDPKSMDQLTYQFRRNFMSEHPPPVDVPILCFASAIGNRFSILRLFHNYVMDRYNEPNDGMVCVCDAIIPGCMSVVLEDTDHAETVCPSTPMTKYSKNRLMDALLHLFFQHSSAETDNEIQ